MGRVKLKEHKNWYFTLFLVYLFMHCAKNVKKFLGVKFFGPHDFKIHQVKSFFPFDRRTFDVKYKCTQCGYHDEKSLVTWGELMEEEGLTNEQIQIAVCGTWDEGLIIKENESELFTNRRS